MRTHPGYHRKKACFEAVLDRASGASTVEAGRARLDRTPFRESYEPGHPLANARGIVSFSNVDPLIEIADAREAKRSYQANLTIFDQARQPKGKSLKGESEITDKAHTPGRTRMNIESSFATQLYASARRIAPAETPAADPAGKPAEGASFAEALAAVSGEMAQTLRAGEVAAQQALTGQGDVQSVVEALTATELALQTAVAVRDRVVEAYQEVLRMPI